MRELSLIVVFFLTSCSNCENLNFDSTQCKPGNPSVGDYDAELSELCTNRIDDNCDGRINEGCTCVTGDISYCGRTAGECRQGSVVCDETGNWPVCLPVVGPDVELCDGLDNDCNGQIDENIPANECWTGSDSAVFSDYSTCKTGTITCVKGVVDCAGQTFPTQEECDFKDNDCNGIIDDVNNLQEVCGPNTEEGACQFGQYVCLGGEKLCLGAVFPSAEACDGFDNDCNGQIDENIIQICITQCGNGTAECLEGQWVNCTADNPLPEVCDGLDNDCNGIIDDGLLCLCNKGDIIYCSGEIFDRETDQLLRCGRGIKECTSTGQWGKCYLYDRTDEVCNNWDDDCDGEIDQFTEECGSLTARSAVGICRPGQRTCVGGEFDDCAGATEPTREQCDHLDNDCDGQIDEDLRKKEKVDFVFVIDISGSMCPYINTLTTAISQYLQDFEATEHKFAIVTVPSLSTSPTYGAYSVLTDFVYAEDFTLPLSYVDCNGGSEEPYYDAIYDTVNPSSPIELTWRDDAYPYVVMLGDEHPQTWAGYTQFQVAQFTTWCQIGNCTFGDKVEIYIITQAEYFFGYEEIVYNEMSRLIDILPNDVDRYANIFRDIFSELCR